MVFIATLPGFPGRGTTDDVYYGRDYRDADKKLQKGCTYPRGQRPHFVDYVHVRELTTAQLPDSIIESVSAVYLTRKPIARELDNSYNPLVVLASVLQTPELIKRWNAVSKVLDELLRIPDGFAVEKMMVVCGARQNEEQEETSKTKAIEDLISYCEVKMNNVGKNQQGLKTCPTWHETLTMVFREDVLSKINKGNIVWLLGGNILCKGRYDSPIDAIICLEDVDYDCFIGHNGPTPAQPTTLVNKHSLPGVCFTKASGQNVYSFKVLKLSQLKEYFCQNDGEYSVNEMILTHRTNQLLVLNEVCIGLEHKVHTPSTIIQMLISTNTPKWLWSRLPDAITREGALL